MLKKFNQLLLTFGLAGLAVLVTTSKVNALTWNFSFTVNGGGGFASGQFTTNGSSYSDPGPFDITGISGSLNGNSLSLDPPGSFDGWKGNNKLYMSGGQVANGPWGWVFNDGIYKYNLYYGGGLERRTIATNEFSDVGYSGLSVTEAAAEVPFDFDPAFGVTLGIPLFIGLRMLKKRVASKKLKYNPTSTVS